VHSETYTAGTRQQQRKSNGCDICTVFAVGFGLSDVGIAKLIGVSSRRSESA